MLTLPCGQDWIENRAGGGRTAFLDSWCPCSEPRSAGLASSRLASCAAVPLPSSSRSSATGLRATKRQGERIDAGLRQGRRRVTAWVEAPPDGSVRRCGGWCLAACWAIVGQLWAPSFWLSWAQDDCARGVRTCIVQHILRIGLGATASSRTNGVATICSYGGPLSKFF